MLRSWLKIENKMILNENSYTWLKIISSKTMTYQNKYYCHCHFADSLGL